MGLVAPRLRAQENRVTMRRRPEVPVNGYVAVLGNVQLHRRATEAPGNIIELEKARVVRQKVLVFVLPITMSFAYARTFDRLSRCLIDHQGMDGPHTVARSQEERSTQSPCGQEVVASASHHPIDHKHLN